MTSSTGSLPRVTVATVVERDGAFLFVEEQARGELVLNQPAGHLDPGETLLQAAIRETREETGWSVQPTHVIGIYQWRSSHGLDFVRIGFAAEAIAHDPDQALDAGIERALWLTSEQMRAERARLRSPLVETLIDDWLAGIRYPLSMLHALSP